MDPQTLGSGSLTLALVAAVLLGARHATDPDHLTALATLVLQDRRVGAGRAGGLGLCWGLGHAATLFAFGLPIVWFGRRLPALIETAAEVAIGVLIAALAVRLLVRWHRGYFHSHAHSHDGVWHVHPHVHEHPAGQPHTHAHRHEHDEAVGRSPLEAFGVGLVHGVGGSGVAGVLLVAAVSQRPQAVLALALFATAIALTMAVASAAFGHVVRRVWLAERFERMVPTLGGASLLFGLWYVLAALAA